jgi:cytochrome c551/c552
MLISIGPMRKEAATASRSSTPVKACHRADRDRVGSPSLRKLAMAHAAVRSEDEGQTSEPGCRGQNAIVKN